MVMFFSFPFVALQQSLGALRASGIAWGHGHGTWISRVDSTLQLWDWQNVGPWNWHHDQEGDFDLSTDDMDIILHKIRNSWRRTCWRDFCNQDRRDSRLFDENQFCPDRSKAASKLFAKASQHGRAVLTGAALSLAVYQVIYQGEASPGCSLCGDDTAVPTWYHLAWKCNALAFDRPPEPSGLVQSRLGWPDCNADDCYNANVLVHLAAVRSKIWSFSPSSRGRRAGY